VCVDENLAYLKNSPGLDRAGRAINSSVASYLLRDLTFTMFHTIARSGVT